MQLTKNLFFWRSGNTVAVALRKILELPVAELLWLEIPRKRVLELYLNTIEFGNGIYGACAASWYYFRLPPAMLSVDEAAQLVGVMPNPKAFRRGTDGGIIQPPRMNTVAWAQAHVPEQIREVGGLAVLRSIGFPDTAQQHLVSHPQGASYNVMPAGVAKRLGWVS